MMLRTIVDINYLILLKNLGKTSPSVTLRGGGMDHYDVKCTKFSLEMLPK